MMMDNIVTRQDCRTRWNDDVDWLVGWFVRWMDDWMDD